MVQMETVKNFLSCSKIAVVGVSRTGKKYGNKAFNELRKKGYNVFPVNPNVNEIEGVKCFGSLKQLPVQVDGAVLAIPPAESMKVLKDAVSAGIKNIWLQQGSESMEAINYCNNNGLKVIYGQCILMFAEPAEFIHRAHRWINGFTGKLPE
ncbi:MAG: CoA-binding protein [Ignavibacteriaceae bacterium]